MSGLADPYLKLDWANKHLEFFESEIAVFKDSKPCRIFSHDDLENKRYVLRIHRSPVPDSISLRCGDVCYCLRSCLDQLVWRLASLKVAVPDRTQFPIIEKWDADGSSKFIDFLPDVPGEAVAI